MTYTTITVPMDEADAKIEEMASVGIKLHAQRAKNEAVELTFSIPETVNLGSR